MSMRGDPTLNALGTTFAALAVLCSTAYKVGTSTIQGQGWGALPLMHEIYGGCALLITCLALAFERNRLLAFDFSSDFLCILLLSSVAAFLTSWSQCMVVGACSALTHSLMGQAKTAAVVMLGVVWGERITYTQMGWAFVALLALTLYTHVNLAEHKSKKKNT
jgi:hypothetical protein